MSASESGTGFGLVVVVIFRHSDRCIFFFFAEEFACRHAQTNHTGNRQFGKFGEKGGDDCEEFFNVNLLKSKNLFLVERITRHRSWIKTIIAQKKLHARWIGEILNKNGIDPTILQDDQWYSKYRHSCVKSFDQNQSFEQKPDNQCWNWENIPDRNLLGFEQFCALFSNYEHINQNKITILAENKFSTKELKNIFKKILKQKQFHIMAFYEMAGNEYDNAEKLIKEFNLRKE